MISPGASRGFIAFLAGGGLGAAAMRAWSLRPGSPEDLARAGLGPAAPGSPAAVRASMERLHGVLGEIRALVGKPGRGAKAEGPEAAGGEPADAPRRDAWRTPDHLSYGISHDPPHGLYAAAALSAVSALAALAALRAVLRAVGKGGDVLPAGPAVAGAVLAAAWLAWRKGAGGAMAAPPGALGAAGESRRLGRTVRP